ncbi:PPH [Symbiodinium necroappetens]|uniref:PPH protein n=1 Tax=Symbiodinium necroappetens TaxID=1628268 RepID=A0A812Y3V9_9DINO|nr:PPH [Symbiodinium necroappetens]
MACLGSAVSNTLANSLHKSPAGLVWHPARSSRSPANHQEPQAARLSAVLCSAVASCWTGRKGRQSVNFRVRRTVTAERTARREELMQPKTATSKKWHWKESITVHYAKAASKIPGTDTAVVLLHGFGVASFHYEAQFGPLSEAGYTVYAADNVGAGLSWPDFDPAPGTPEEIRSPGTEWGFGKPRPPFEEMVIGEQLWVEQVKDFIAECVEESNVIIGGNSLGGYLTVLATATMNTRLLGRIKGVFLLNATPFWGWIPNRSKNPDLHDAFPWKGQFPVPESVRPLTLAWYNTLRNPDSIEWLLNFVTSNPAGVGHELAERIATMADHPAGAAAFAQILFTPQADLTFEEALDEVVKCNIPVFLLYGREDPWIIPYWAARAYTTAPDADYVQLSPSGHCPHYETPAAVNESLLRWLQDKVPVDGQGPRQDLPGSIGASFTVKESDGREVVVTRRGFAEPFRENELAWDEFPAWLQQMARG